MKYFLLLLSFLFIFNIYGEDNFTIVNRFEKEAYQKINESYLEMNTDLEMVMIRARIRRGFYDEQLKKAIDDITNSFILSAKNHYVIPVEVIKIPRKPRPILPIAIEPISIIKERIKTK